MTKSHELDERAYLTAEEYTVWNDAYIFFNEMLFNGELVSCLITLNNRNNRSYGFYHHDKFSSRESPAERVAEIALNPDKFNDRESIVILGTLVHEMVHLWQFQTGHPSRGYHNREFADKMESLGLMPSNTGEPGGKRTGSQMTQYILEGGPFERFAMHFLKENQLTWQSNRMAKTEKKDTSKTPYQCPECELKAWAKLGAVLFCGACGIPMPKEPTHKFNKCG